MKKAFLAGLLAICVIAAAQQQASAWTNIRFGVGLNYSRQSGGNSVGWGAWRNGQPPGPEAMHHGHSFPAYGPLAPSGFGPFAGGATEPTAFEPAYAPQPMAYPAPYQFATYPRPIYYYPAPSYFYYGR